MRNIRWIVVVLLALGLYATADVKTTLTPPTREEMTATRKVGRYLATITMAGGKKIELVLEGAEMPYTVANFVKLANAHFYDGLTYHRVEKGFVVQGGDPNGDGTGGPGYQLNLEISPLLRHKRGAISMARNDEPIDSAGSQFFITQGEWRYLNGKYAVFGWVKSGLDVVDALKVGDVMKTVSVEPYKGKEACPILDSGPKPVKETTKPADLDHKGEK